MLPNLERLSLQPRGAAQTGDFCTLTDDQVTYMEENQIVETMSQHTPPAGRAKCAPGAVFRVAKKKGADPNVLDDYYYLDAASAWQLARTNPVDPFRRFWWYEDWAELRRRYEPQMPIPYWAHTLPALHSDEAWLAKKHQNKDDCRVINGELVFYEGPRDQKRKVRKEFPSGHVKLYEGSKGEERVVQVTFPDKQVAFYEGPRGEEHMVRFKYTDGHERLFTGPKGQERPGKRLP